MNKRGFLRVVEATVSVMIVMGVLFIFFTQARVSTSPDYSEDAREILEELSRVSSLREAVLNGDMDSINIFVVGRIDRLGSFLAYEIVICSVGDACGTIEYHEGDIYTAERVISSSLGVDPDELEPKKIRLFIWRTG